MAEYPSAMAARYWAVVDVLTPSLGRVEARAQANRIIKVEITAETRHQFLTLADLHDGPDEVPGG